VSIDLAEARRNLSTTQSGCFLCQHANQENGVSFRIAQDHEDQVETHHEVIKQKNGCDAKSVLENVSRKIPNCLKKSASQI